jgi:CHAD domain-containing protein
LRTGARGEELKRTGTTLEQFAKVGRRSFVAATLAAGAATAALGQSRDYDLLRRAEKEPPLHHREPVVLRRLRQHAGRAHRLKGQNHPR